MSSSSTFSREFTHETAGATVTPVLAVEIPGNGSLIFNCTFVATNKANQKAVGIWVKGGVKCSSGVIADLGGTIVEQDPADGGHAQGFEPGGVSISTSGSRLIFNVSGIAATDVVWSGALELVLTLT